MGTSVGLSTATYADRLGHERIKDKKARIVLVFVTLQFLGAEHGEHREDWCEDNWKEKASG